MRASHDVHAIFRLTTIAKTNEPFRGVRRPTGRERPKDRKDDQGRNDQVVQIGPDGLAAGGAYKRLLIALIEAEGPLDPREFKDCA